MTEKTPLYYDEGINGTNKYTFEVYQEDNGSYTVFVRRWNRKLNLLQEETKLTSASKAGLRDLAYPNSRQGKAFLASAFWNDDDVGQER